MATKVEILSREIIKPSSPTSDHLREFKISLLDQLAPPIIYVPLILFYSSSDISPLMGDNFKMISDQMKTSLSDILTLYYPFCGRMRGNATVECNDEGALYLEARISCNLSDILANPETNLVKEFLPFDPYNPGTNCNEHVNMAVQVNEFSCGGLGLGVCILHKIADGATMATFVDAWAKATKGVENLVLPHAEAPLLFPPKELDMEIFSGMKDIIQNGNTVTKRFILNGANLSRLKAQIDCFNATRVEAVTALIWKSTIEAARESSEEKIDKASIMIHSVNIRSRMVPPLPENSLGNLWLKAISPVIEMNKMVDLNDLAKVVRKMIREIDGDYVRQFPEGLGVAKDIEFWKHLKSSILDGSVRCYIFSSWTRFPFYEVDFGWGKPTWVCTIASPVANNVFLMPTRSGDGIEAWVTLPKHEMDKLELSPEILQFASLN